MASTAASSRGRIGSPEASSRSGTGKRQRRGTSGTGFSMSMSYCSKRLSVPISMESRNPSVVTSAVRAPLRSISALVASVVPWITSATSSGATALASIAWARAWRTPSSGASGVVSTFAVIRSGPRSSTISVKVPPISTPIRTAAPAPAIYALPPALGRGVCGQRRAASRAGGPQARTARPRRAPKARKPSERSERPALEG